MLVLLRKNSDNVHLVRNIALDLFAKMHIDLIWLPESTLFVRLCTRRCGPDTSNNL